MRKAVVAASGAVGAGFLGALCCVGAPILIALGVGSGFLGAIAPWRPLFGLLTVGFVAFGFYVVYVRQPGRQAVSPGTAAAPPVALPRASASRDRRLLWIGATLAALLWSLPVLLELFGAGGH